jgi:hypothetical protein
VQGEGPAEPNGPWWAKISANDPGRAKPGENDPQWAILYYIHEAGAEADWQTTICPAKQPAESVVPNQAVQRLPNWGLFDAYKQPGHEQKAIKPWDRTEAYRDLFTIGG